MIKKILYTLRNLTIIDSKFNRLLIQNDNLKLNNGNLKDSKVLAAKILIELHKNKRKIQSFEEIEFQVFSQWGDDGIIQYIINNIEIPNKTFIEFGVENYTESNTRFLLVNNNWEGLVIDGSEENVEYIKRDYVSWSNLLHVKHSFITKENINSLLADFAKKNEEIGILSVDIDGNDYWVWKEIDIINPVIVISEYNSIFGDSNPWTIPYDPNFVRSSDFTNYKSIFYGASITSLCDLANEKGYAFIGCNSAGNNAYFIRKDKLGDLKELTPQEGYKTSQFRELFSESGDRVGGVDRNTILKDKNLTVYNTRTNVTEKYH